MCLYFETLRIHINKNQCFSLSTEISLQQRLEYIARAILSAKSSTAISSTAADGEFLHEMEEKMEVSEEDTSAEQHSHMLLTPFFPYLAIGL